MRIKQLCNRKVRDFAMPLWARKVSGAFEKRPPGEGRGGLCETLRVTVRSRTIRGRLETSLLVSAFLLLR